jgi:ATP-dependent DNA helicase RecQ
VYVIRRADVDELTQGLQEAGVRAVPYHAGLDESARAEAQERWMAGTADVVVATVAFGMGIDRPDVRYVVHAAMPQSPEHYQQETGRAGRDGADAECFLFWSPGDADVWRGLIRAQASPQEAAKDRLVTEMHRLCTSGRCRHRMLVEYFSQRWTREGCGACDICERQAISVPEAGSDPVEERRCFELLKRCRNRIADARDMAGSSIATDSALREIARLRPGSIGELRRIAGMGRRGIADWGRRLLAALRDVSF